MQAYQFETVIQEEGILKIPELEDLVNHRVEVFVIDKTPIPQNSEIQSFDHFKNKWKGFLKNVDLADCKDERILALEEKYQ